MTRIKICCINSVAEANLAIKYGAAAIGLVGDMPSGPGIIDDGLIRQIVAAIPPFVTSVLLTSETTANKITDHFDRTLTSTIQIVDYIDEEEYSKLRVALPHVKIIQVVHVMDRTDIQKAINLSAYVDAILLDSGNPNMKVLGGTGNRHDWTISREIVKSVNKPVILAGGINSQNIADAVSFVQPFAIDLCSGVRTDGKLDERKLKALFAAI